MTLRAACIQMTAGPVIADNLAAAETLIRAAATDGAKLIATPENTDCIRAEPADKLRAPPEDAHPALPFFSALAQKLDVWILVGSLGIRVEDSKRIANRSFLFDNTGAIVARYDKIHLFDVDLPTGESRRESDTVRPGTQAILAPTPWGTLGLSICYDVRFAALYRRLAQAGATILAVPAAFTVPTGQAHWHVLLRARAIETGSFVLAPTQCGTHEGGRLTYGHALIVGPWGDILAEAHDTPGFIAADLDLTAPARARAAIPALELDAVPPLA